MFTSSMSSFRHARTSGTRGRLGLLSRRVGVVGIAVAFMAALPSPASAAPGTVDLVGMEPTAFTQALTDLPADTSAGIPPDLVVDTTLGSTGNASTGNASTGNASTDKAPFGKAPFGKANQPRRAASRAMRVMGVAAAQAGDPYVYGAAGPNAFDCSGLTSFVYRVAAGRRLPHSSAAQRGATQPISRAAARPGDLVFFYSGGRIYHVGIFAGGNSIIHASKPGVPVGRSQIWTSAVSFGRVR